MATKRQAPEDGEAQNANRSFKNKRRKPNGGPGGAGGRPFKIIKKAHPVNELKSQIRSLKRLLEKNDDLPAGVRIEKERALQTAQHELDLAHRAKARSEMIGRYHKIRFFDRQKATRRLKKAKKELRAYEGEDEEERKRLGAAVDEAETEVNYAQFYPLEKVYVSMFPRRKGGEEEKDDSQPVERHADPEMWETIKKCMADGTLEALREGKLLQDKELEKDEPVAPALASNSKSAKGESAAKKKVYKVKGAASRKKDEVDDQEDDDSSDGGFFE